MFSEIGIMQGRLLPNLNGRYQAHPLGYWQQEFAIAKELGVKYIEFILDYNDFEQNPLMTSSGLEELKSIMQESGVGVRSVCADYFMEAPLHVESNEVATKSIAVLEQLLNHAAMLGITDIVIPCVDQSSLTHSDDQDRLVRNLQKPLELAIRYGINLALETDLDPATFLQLLNKFDSKRITVNYDTGNSAALGYAIEEEFEAYGDRISDIHIKDRVLGGGSVVLGSGNTDFERFFNLLPGLRFNGPIVMQVYRDEEGIAVFRQQLDWLRKKYSDHKK